MVFQSKLIAGLGLGLAFSGFGSTTFAADVAAFSAGVQSLKSVSITVPHTQAAQFSLVQALAAQAKIEAASKLDLMVAAAIEAAAVKVAAVEEAERLQLAAAEQAQRALEMELAQQEAARAMELLAQAEAERQAELEAAQLAVEQAAQAEAARLAAEQAQATELERIAIQEAAQIERQLAEQQAELERAEQQVQSERQLALEAAAQAETTPTESQLTLEWAPAEFYEDGSVMTLQDISHYQLVFGREADNLDQVEELTVAGLLNVDFESVVRGTWFVGMQTVSIYGGVSDTSNIIALNL